MIKSFLWDYLPTSAPARAQNTVFSRMAGFIQSPKGKRQILVKLPRSVKPESRKAGVGAIPTLPTSFSKIARMVANCPENSRWHITWLHRFESYTFRQIFLAVPTALAAGYVHHPFVSGYFFGANREP